jgi:virginiamycin A acetyltransferase
MKDFLKHAVDGICLVIMLPAYFLYYVFAMIGGKDNVFWGFSQALSLLPGLPGNYLRKNFYRMAMARCDRNCAILFGTIFSHLDTEVGKDVYIGPNCNIGKCRIEDYCTIGSNVHIMSGKGQHNFEDPATPIREQGGTFEKIILGEDTWVGNGALIMANIGKKCIIGAGSVVTKEIEDFSIVAGNPARMLRKRPSDA